MIPNPDNNMSERNVTNEQAVFITLTNRCPYRKGARVAIASHVVTAIEENAFAEYENGSPPGVVPQTFVYTTGGNQFQVMESFDEVADALGATPISAVVPRRTRNTSQSEAPSIHT